MALIMVPPFDPNEADFMRRLALKVLEDNDDDPSMSDYPPHLPTEDEVRLNLTYLATAWADLILIGLNQGKKPEILVDRSGSMDNLFVEMMGNTRYSRMDVSRILIVMVADVLSKRNAGFDLTQIPVKSWGSDVYDEHPMMTKGGQTITPKTTLADFHKTTKLPMIPCTDGTNHSHWFNESDYPLVITDDYYEPNQYFIENYRNFSWCNAANIIAVDNKGQEPRMRRVDAEIAKLASE